MDSSYFHMRTRKETQENEKQSKSLKNITLVPVARGSSVQVAPRCYFQKFFTGAYALSGTNNLDNCPYQSLNFCVIALNKTASIR